MNTRDHFDARQWEHEWQLQERALREERAGAPAPEERNLAAYREIAHALRQPPAEGLPLDFAARVAALAQVRAAVPDTRLEQWLVHALLALLAGAGAFEFLKYGGQAWVADTLALVPASLLDTGLPWLLALGGCLALSWSIEPLRRSLATRPLA
jgi:hypothetical protein